METPTAVASTSPGLPRTSARRSCPYPRTPLHRRIAAPKSAAASSSSTPTGRSRRTPISQHGRPSSLPGVVNKTWQVFYLSPLYKFSTRPHSLKQYSRSLAAYIVARGDKQVAVDDRHRQCTFSVYEGLQAAPGDPEAVQILVTVNGTNDRTQKTRGTVVLTAILCGVDLESNPCQGLKEYFTYYPLLLVKGRAALTSILKSWLEEHFDCRLSVFVPTSVDLSWMVAMWSGTIAEKKNKPVELMYTVPEECEGLTRVTYSIDPTDCKALWDSLWPEDKEEFTDEDVATFMNSLQQHFYECFKVKLWKMQLSQIGTAMAYVGGSRVKMFAADNAWQVLRMLSELALERFQQLATV